MPRDRMKIEWDIDPSVSDVWECTKCGRIVTDRPKRNQTCQKDGCTGRFMRFSKCDCGKWFNPQRGKKYCSKDCTSRKEKLGHKVHANCAYCGADICRPASDMGKHMNFCNIDCLRAYEASLRVERTCKQCGKRFTVLESSLSEATNSSGNFCCRKCYNEYQKTLTGSKNNHYTSIEKNCEWCGKPIRVIPYKAAAYKHSFCSLGCRSRFMAEEFRGEKSPNWKGGSTSSRGNFEQVKREHFSGAQFCAICGTTKNIHIHHIIPYRLTQDNSVDNLIPLCASHHKKVENATLKFTEMFDDGSYDVAKFYLNIMLREKQLMTRYVISELMKEAS